MLACAVVISLPYTWLLSWSNIHRHAVPVVLTIHYYTILQLLKKAPGLHNTRLANSYIKVQSHLDLKNENIPKLTSGYCNKTFFGTILRVQHTIYSTYIMIIPSAYFWDVLIPWFSGISHLKFTSESYNDIIIWSIFMGWQLASIFFFRRYKRYPLIWYDLTFTCHD